MFEVGPGFTARLRWDRAEGVQFSTDEPLTPEAIAGKWKEINDFSGNTTHPESPAEAMSLLIQAAAAKRPAKAMPAKGGNKILEKAQSIKISPVVYKYDNQEGSCYV